MENLILRVQPLAFLFPRLKYVCLNSEKLLCLLDSMQPHILNIKAAAPNSCPILWSLVSHKSFACASPSERPADLDEKKEVTGSP